MGDETKPNKPETRGRRRRLKKSDEGYYATVGSIGGKSTLENHGKEYFSRLAKLSHLRRRQRAAEQAKKKKPGSAS